MVVSMRMAWRRSSRSMTGQKSPLSICCLSMVCVLAGAAVLKLNPVISDGLFYGGMAGAAAQAGRDWACRQAAVCHTAGELLFFELFFQRVDAFFDAAARVVGEGLLVEGEGVFVFALLFGALACDFEQFGADLVGHVVDVQAVV